MLDPILTSIMGYVEDVEASRDHIRVFEAPQHLALLCSLNTERNGWNTASRWLTEFMSFRHIWWPGIKWLKGCRCSPGCSLPTLNAAAHQKKKQIMLLMKEEIPLIWFSFLLKHCGFIFEGSSSVLHCAHCMYLFLLTHLFSAKCPSEESFRSDQFPDKQE